MKRNVLSLPEALRIQVLLRGALMLGALFIGVGTLWHGNYFMSLPMLLLCTAMGASVCSIACGKYVVVTGKCIKTEKNLLQSRQKWIILNNEQCVLRIRVQNRWCRVGLGEEVTVYLRQNSRLYEQDGMFTVYDFIALRSERVLTDE